MSRITSIHCPKILISPLDTSIATFSNFGFSGKLKPIKKYNAQLTTDQDGSTGVRPLVGITSVIDCPPDEHFK